MIPPCSFLRLCMELKEFQFICLIIKYLSAAYDAY